MLCIKCGKELPAECAIALCENCLFEKVMALEVGVIGHASKLHVEKISKLKIVDMCTGFISIVVVGTSAFVARIALTKGNYFIVIAECAIAIFIIRQQLKAMEASKGISQLEEAKVGLYAQAIISKRKEVVEDIIIGRVKLDGLGLEQMEKKEDSRRKFFRRRK